MEAGHCSQIRGQGFALACLHLLHEKVHGLLDDELGGVVALCRASLIRRVAAVAPLRRIFTVRRGLAAGCAIAGGVGCDAGALIFHVDAPA